MTQQSSNTAEHRPAPFATSILWRKLDGPGHDACTVAKISNGWRLEGAAVFSEDRQPVRLAYEVICNTNWHTRRAVIRGFIGEREFVARIQRNGTGVWTLNGDIQPQVADCIDIDLGFTPATNIIAIRRLSLDMGAFAMVRSAWLNFADGEFGPIDQRYMRQSNHRYEYDSPRFDYHAILTVNDVGFVTEYPTLFSVEP